MKVQMDANGTGEGQRYHVSLLKSGSTWKNLKDFNKQKETEVT